MPQWLANMLENIGSAAIVALIVRAWKQRRALYEFARRSVRLLGHRLLHSVAFAVIVSSAFVAALPWQLPSIPPGRYVSISACPEVPEVSGVSPWPRPSR
jgi:hypothetical protein